MKRFFSVKTLAILSAAIALLASCQGEPEYINLSQVILLVPR